MKTPKGVSMDRILVEAKALQIGDFVVIQPVDENKNPINKQFAERVTAIGINLSDRTVDVRTDNNGKTRSSMGLPLDLELEIFRPKDDA